MRITSRRSLPNSRASYSVAASVAAMRAAPSRCERAAAPSCGVPSAPSKCRVMKVAARLAMFTYLPMRSLLTRARKSSGLKSMSSTLALSLAAM